MRLVPKSLAYLESSTVIRLLSGRNVSAFTVLMRRPLSLIAGLKAMPIVRMATVR